MIPANFANSNVILGPPAGETEDSVQSVFAWRGFQPNGRQVVVTRRRPSAEELAELAAGKDVWLFVAGVTMQPAYLVVHSEAELFGS